MSLRAAGTLSESSDAGTLNLDASVVAVRKDWGSVLIERANIGHGGNVVSLGGLRKGLVPENGMSIDVTNPYRASMVLLLTRGTQVKSSANNSEGWEAESEVG